MRNLKQNAFVLITTTQTSSSYPISSGKRTVPYCILFFQMLPVLPLSWLTFIKLLEEVPERTLLLCEQYDFYKLNKMAEKARSSYGIRQTVFYASSKPKAQAANSFLFQFLFLQFYNRICLIHINSFKVLLTENVTSRIHPKIS